jgi:hypothetical protein
MSAMQYYVGTDIDVGSMGQTCMVCPYFCEREEIKWLNFQALQHRQLQ